MARVALVGDYDAKKTAHVAIPLALARAQQIANIDLHWEWIGTHRVLDPAVTLGGFDGIWVTPGSPYADMAGALAAIRYARENGVPFLGTCGGFQHALIEFARNVAGIAPADHAETNRRGDDLVVTALSCSLVDRTGGIAFTPGSHMQRIFGAGPVTEGYHCNYGLNPAYRQRLEQAGLRFTGFDAAGEIRAFELPGHPFFLGTLFQPERSALRDADHPLISALVAALR
jgi:CTP synthase (UTP-ammonia lyase)